MVFKYPHRSRFNKQGFSLIELIIVITIMVILGVVAYKTLYKPIPARNAARLEISNQALSKMSEMYAQGNSVSSKFGGESLSKLVDSTQLSISNKGIDSELLLAPVWSADGRGSMQIAFPYQDPKSEYWSVKVIGMNLNISNFVQSTDRDMGLGIANAVSNAKYVDINGNSTYDIGESVYIDLDSDGLVSVGDLRLSAYDTAYKGGTVVAAGQSDVSLPLVTTGGFSAKATVNGSLTSSNLQNNAVYWDVDGNNSVSANDVRIFTPSLIVKGNGATLSFVNDGATAGSSNNDINKAFVSNILNQ